MHAPARKVFALGTIAAAGMHSKILPGRAFCSRYVSRNPLITSNPRPSHSEIGGDNPCYQHLSELGHGLAERRRLRKGILIGFSRVANTLGISLVVAHGSLP
jgi:hypothetical protein